MDLFNIVICSDFAYERLVSDVNYGNTHIAIISNENNIFEIELFPHTDSTSIKFPLDEFCDAVKICKSALTDARLKTKNRIDNDDITNFEINIINNSIRADKVMVINHNHIHIANMYNKKDFIEIELFMQDSSESIRFRLEEFIEAVKAGKQALL